MFMPISGDEWDEAHNRPTEQVILEFLHNNPDQAFTTIEIAENVNIKLYPETKSDAEHRWRAFAAALFRLRKIKTGCDKLVKEGKVSKKFIDSDGGRTYYFRYSG